MAKTFDWTEDILVIDRDISDKRWFTSIYTIIPASEQLVRLILKDVKP